MDTRPRENAAAGATPAGRPLRAVMLPPIAWQPARTDHVPGGMPDPFVVEEVLRAHGIETTLIDPGTRPWNPLAGKNSVLNGLDPLRGLRVLLRERRADILVCVAEAPAVPLVLLRRLLGVRIPIALWDIGLTETWKLRERILDLVVPRVEAIMVLGSSQVPYIEGRWHPRARLEVIGHMVDAAFWRGGPVDPTGPVLALGEDVGRDYATLNEAVRGLDLPVQVKTRRGPEAFGGAVAPNLEVLRGWMSYPELRTLYDRASMVVVPLLETLNASGVSTVLEAMAMGRPVVMTDTAAMRDFVRPDDTCLTVPIGDAAALRAAILRLQGDPALAARLGAAGRAMVEERFADRVFAANFARVLREIAEAR